MPTKYLTIGQNIGGQTEDASSFAMYPIHNAAGNGGRLKISSIPIGPTALASIGTNTTDIAGQWWVTDIFIPYNRVITKVGVLAGGTATTDNIMVAIWNGVGQLRGYSAIAGQVLAGANTFQELSIVLDKNGATITSLQLYGPQQYFIGVQGNGTTAGSIQTVKAATYINIVSSTVAGTFGTVPTSLTVPTTWTADNAPIVYVA